MPRASTLSQDILYWCTTLRCSCTTGCSRVPLSRLYLGVICTHVSIGSTSTLMRPSHPSVLLTTSRSPGAISPPKATCIFTHLLLTRYESLTMTACEVNCTKFMFPIINSINMVISVGTFTCSVFFTINLHRKQVLYLNKVCCCLPHG